LQEYKDLFKNDLNTYKFEKIDLKLALGANSIFVKSRPIVPFSIQRESRTRKKGIIELMDNLIWSTPLVPIIKKDDNLRIYADYKVTVNK